MELRTGSKTVILCCYSYFVTDPNDIIRAMAAYGEPGEDNGVRLRIGDPGVGKTGNIIFYHETDVSAPSGLRAAVQITIKSGLKEIDLMAAVAHEGTHAADAQDFMRSITSNGDAQYDLNRFKYDYEMRAYSVEHAVYLLNNQTRPFDCGQARPCRLGVDAGIQTRQIQDHLYLPPYSVSPSALGSRMYPGFVPPTATTPQK